MQAKIFFVFTLLLIAVAAHSQLKKGSKMIGTSIGTSVFSTGTTEYTYPNGTQGYTAKSNSWSINLTPSIGSFIQNNSVVGGSLILNTSHQKAWNENTSGLTFREDNYRNTDFGLGAFFRYYFTTANRINPFAHVYLNGGSGSTKTDGFYIPKLDSLNSYTGKSSDRFFYNAGINLGATKMISASVGLEAFVGFSHSNTKFTTTVNETRKNNTTTDNLEYQPTQRFSGNGVNIGIGLQVFLPK